MNGAQTEAMAAAPSRSPRKGGGKLGRIVPPALVMAAIIAVWWIVVARTESPIFPTPMQVVTGAFELAQE